MDTNDHTIFCSRCGAEMKSSARYCMKCGNLNYDHPDNKDMRQFATTQQYSSYQIGSGNSILGNVTNGKEIVESIANNTGSKRFCFYVTLLFYLVTVLGSFLFVFLKNGQTFDIGMIAGSIFPYILMISSIIFLYIYAIEVMFMKANKRWWAGLIPIYNVMILSEMAFNKKMLGLIVLVPIVGLVYLFVVFYKVGEKFKYSGLITALFSLIMVPVIAFGISVYDSRIFVESGVSNSTEIEYKRKNTFLGVTCLFFVVGIGLLIYANMTQVSSATTQVGNYYYMYASKKMLKKTKKAIDEGSVVCDNDVVYSPNSGVYYFHSADVGEEFGLFLQIMRDPIQGYIKVDNSSGSSVYSITLADGKKGFPETLEDDISGEKVVDYQRISQDYKNGFNCYIKG